MEARCRLLVKIIGEYDINITHHLSIGTTGSPPKPIERYDLLNMVTALPPLIFQPTLVSKPWGGRRLESLGKRLPPKGRFGESWELSHLSGPGLPPPSQLATGPLAGQSLPDLIRKYGPALLGSTRQFPLLFKFLDAREPLSVQVHPSLHYAATHQGMQTKTESWYVVDADPKAVIYKGFQEGVSPNEVRAVAGTSSIVNLLQAYPARPGDFHHLPPGTVHALGSGLLITEPQTPAHTTLRLYDWADIYPRPRRPLHVDQALDALIWDPLGIDYQEPMEHDGNRLLSQNVFYRIWEHQLHSQAVEIENDGELRVVTVVGGEAKLEYEGGNPMALATGTTVLIPALRERISIAAQGSATWLEVSPTV